VVFVVNTIGLIRAYLQLIFLLALLVVGVDILYSLARGRLVLLGTGLALRGRRLTTFRHGGLFCSETVFFRVSI
jgi:hypothetical protein